MRSWIAILLFAACSSANADPRESEQDRISRQTYDDARKNAEEFRKKQLEAWRSNSKTAKVQQDTPPRDLPRCADAASAAFGCKIVKPLADLAGQNNLRSIGKSGLIEIADRLSIGPPSHCLAQSEIPARKLAWWALYCGASKDAAIALAMIIDPTLDGAIKPTKGSTSTSESDRVHRAVKDIEDARIKREANLASEKKQTLIDCDKGKLAACERFEQIALVSPGASSEEVWWHSIAQQCRLGSYGKCRRAAEIARQHRVPKAVFEMDRIGCLGGNGDQCSYVAGWTIADDPLGAVRLVHQGCKLGDKSSCEILRGCVEKGCTGACHDLAAEETVLKDACRAGQTSACVGKRTTLRDVLFLECKNDRTPAWDGSTSCDRLIAESVAAKSCKKQVPADALKVLRPYCKSRPERSEYRRKEAVAGCAELFRR